MSKEYVVRESESMIDDVVTCPHCQAITCVSAPCSNCGKIS